MTNDTDELLALSYMLAKQVPDMARGFTVHTNYGDIAIRADEAQKFMRLTEKVVSDRIDMIVAGRTAIKGALERMHLEIIDRPRPPDFELALLRLKLALGVRNNFEVAQFIGMSAQAFSERRRRHAFPEKDLRAAVQQRPDLAIDVDYVLTGVRGDVK